MSALTHEFSTRVIAARTATGLSQREFAKRYRIPLGTLRGWEQSRRRTPDAAALVFIVLVGLEPELTARIIDEAYGEEVIHNE